MANIPLTYKAEVLILKSLKSLILLISYSWINKMNISAFDWNVVVVGFWNRAILTPAGIGTRLFGLEEGTPIEVEIPIDIISPPRVRYSGLTVYVEPNRLAVGIEKQTYCDFDRARVIAIKGIQVLPETPFTAAGFNVRIKIDEPTDNILTMTKSKIDDFLSDAAFEIKVRKMTRALNWNEGLINLSITQQENIVVQMNFDRQSSKSTELIAWLNHPIADVKDTVKKIFEDVIKVPLGEIGE